MAKYLKSVGVPVLYYILVETNNDNDEEVIASAKQMVLDILEENWDDQFGYDNQVLEFEGFEWVRGEYAHTIEEREESGETTKATEGGTSTASGELRDPISDVQDPWGGDEGLPM